jgi:cobalt-zinc-cadmium efflux system protein
VLILKSIIVLTEAVPRLFQPERPNATGMLLFALVGVVVNGVAA